MLISELIKKLKDVELIEKNLSEAKSLLTKTPFGDQEAINYLQHRIKSLEEELDLIVNIELLEKES